MKRDTCITLFLMVAAVFVAFSIRLPSMSHGMGDVRPHNFNVALEQVLGLQSLALQESDYEGACFIAHIGSACPPVWHDERVLDNFKHMVEAGVDVRLSASIHNYDGGANYEVWVNELRTKFQERGLSNIIYVIQERESYSHSIIAGSSENLLGYITIHQKDNRYPTEFFNVDNQDVCEEWRDNLLESFLNKIDP